MQGDVVCASNVNILKQLHSIKPSHLAGLTWVFGVATLENHFATVLTVVVAVANLLASQAICNCTLATCVPLLLFDRWFGKQIRTMLLG